MKVQRRALGHPGAVWRAGLAALLLGAGTAAAQSQPTGTFIPVLVNLYTGGPTEQEARDAVSAANEILRQADVRLVVVKVQTMPEMRGAGTEHGGDDGSGGGTADDGRFTSNERNEARNFGGKELNDPAKVANRKGIKISFGEQPNAAYANLEGVSIHENRTTLVKYAGGAAGTGNTIAHEVGHVMTLGPGHQVSPTETADAGGHASSAGNIMSPARMGRGTTLTKEQAEEMQKHRYEYGKCATQFQSAFPALKDQLGFGRAADDRGDEAPKSHLGPGSGIYDLEEVVLTALVTDSDLSARLTLAEPLPGSEEIDAVYTLGFDADADAGTGVLYAGLPGVDRIVRARLAGNVGLGTLTVTGEVEDPVLATVVPLSPAPALATEQEFHAAGASSVPAALSVRFTIPKLLLAQTAAVAPVVATAGTAASILDTAVFEFDSERWLHDPTLTTFGTGVPTPGADYPVAFSGLAPGSPFNLYLDETLVLSGVLDGTGAFSGSFTFPADLSVTELHFLTAQDDTGEFAYSITCPFLGAYAIPVAGPAALAALIVALAGTAFFLLHRRVPRPGAGL